MRPAAEPRSVYGGIVDLAGISVPSLKIRFLAGL
jgi:hypothetical protein